MARPLYTMQHLFATFAIRHFFESARGRIAELCSPIDVSFASPLLRKTKFDLWPNTVVMPFAEMSPTRDARCSESSTRQLCPTDILQKNVDDGCQYDAPVRGRPTGSRRLIWKYECRDFSPRIIVNMHFYS